MRYLTALCFLAACGGGSATPYSNARAEMCGSAPTGAWDVTTIAPLELPAGTAICNDNPVPVWDFSGNSIDTLRVYDQGCRIECSGYGGSIDVDWSAPNEYTGTIYTPASAGGSIACTFYARVKLTPHE